MNRRRISWRRVAIVLGTLVVIGGGGLAAAIIFDLGGWIRARYWNTDPQFAQQMARNMIDYTLPPGFQEQKAMDISQTRIVIIETTGQPENIQIALIQPPLNLNDPEWRDSIEDSWAQRVDRHKYDTNVINTRTVTIRGNPTTLKIREGQDETGQKVRQITGIITGKQGELILTIVGPQDVWDQPSIDQFINSIR